MSSFALQTPRLLLRDFTLGDKADFCALTDDGQYRQYYPEDKVSRAYYAELFQLFLDWAEERSRKKYQLAICLHDGQFIGTCGLRVESTDEKSATLGFALARAYWGQGYAHEAAAHMVEWGFSAWGLERICADTNGENARSRALLEKLGMRPESFFKRRFFFRGCWWDKVVYGLSADEWIKGSGRDNLAIKISAN